MSGLEAAQELLAKLSRAEKAQVLQWAAHDLGDAFPGSSMILWDDPF